MIKTHMLTYTLDHANVKVTSLNAQHVIEDNLPFIRQSAEMMTIEPNEAYLYNHDLYGLLNAKGIPQEIWWTTLRLNNMDCPTQYTEEKIVLYIPKLSTVSDVVSVATNFEN